MNFKKTFLTAVLFISTSLILAQTVNIPPLPIDSTHLKKQIYRASNTRMNDIIHTRLEVNFDWNKCRMNGKAAIEIKPYFYPVDKLFLNARGMNILKLEVYETIGGTKANPAGGGKAQPFAPGNKIKNASYVYENDSLKISLGRTFYTTEHYFVMMDYVAQPNELKSEGGSKAISDDKGLYFINPKGENPLKMPQIWTQGETQSNSVWMPTIDSPNEKMTQEILMTVDNKYTTLSNGTLISSIKKPDNTRTDHWKQDLPHSPYLAMMAVGEFKKVVDAPWNGKEISYYVEKDYEPYAKQIFGDTREMIDFFSNKLGVPFAWPKYSQIAVRDYVSGAMENTSATLHGDFMVYQTDREMADEKKANGVVSHELFHQWFGDLVTCESWSNLSLNESFATYGTYLWEEYKQGREEADKNHYQSRQGYLRSEKEADLIRFYYNDKEDMFDAISYNKGGQILHMLRKAVGDAAFFASLKNYLEKNKFQSAEVHNLRLAFEEVTGRDMNWFFNEWYLNKGKPELKISKKYEGGNLELTVEQKQDLNQNPLYTLPLDVDIYYGGKIEKKNILITEQKQSFIFKIPTEPQLVNFDAERQLLAKIDYEKSKMEYMFQYKNAPLYEDRLEALKALENQANDNDVYAFFKDAAKNDKFYALRESTLRRLEKINDDKKPDLKLFLIDVYKTEKHVKPRCRALDMLNTRYDADADVLVLNEAALKETSCMVIGTALEGFNKNSPKIAVERAKTFENENAKDILLPVAHIYSLNGSDNELAFFKKNLKWMNGFEILSFCRLYVATTLRCSNIQNFLSTGKDLAMLAKGANKTITGYLSNYMKDVIAATEAKEKTSTVKKEIDELKSMKAELNVLKEKME